MATSAGSAAVRRLASAAASRAAAPPFRPPGIGATREASVEAGASIAISAPSSASAPGLPYLLSSALNPHATVAKWIFGTTAAVAGMVHVGGVTRLTKSGLSMTDWKPLGSLPPLTDEDWEAEFDRYKRFPEFLQRKGMDVEEFKYIYYWEWGHRMLGRAVGIVFAAPWAYFAARGRIPPGYGPRMAALFAMGGTQGLVGWWMVKSGLGEDRREDSHEIRVSPYRLAAHLGMAFATYSALVWTGLGISQIPNDAPSAADGASRLREVARSLSSSAMRHARKVRGGALGVANLAFLTAISGAFVAGNDAGNAYNTFPLMDGRIVPVDDMIDPDLIPAYRNLFENTATVQWDHRALGTTTALAAVSLAGMGMFHPAARGAITPQASRGVMFLGGAALAQVSLGVATLLNYVPIGLAAAHQMGSLVVLTGGIYVVHSLRYASPRVVRSLGNNAAAKKVEEAAMKMAK